MSEPTISELKNLGVEIQKANNEVIKHKHLTQLRVIKKELE